MTESRRTGPADEALLARLGHLADQIDPVPESTYQLAHAALALRSIDSELAELVDDSDLHADELTAVRGMAEVRLLSYQTDDVAIELQVARQDRGHSVLGQVIGAAVGEIRIDTATRAETVPVDDLGQFTLDGLPGGPFRIRLTGPGGTPVTTDWTTL
jgi:hypothetical protein